MTKRCCLGNEAANFDLSEGLSAIVNLSKEAHEGRSAEQASDVAGTIHVHLRPRPGAKHEVDAS